MLNHKRETGSGATWLIIILAIVAIGLAAGAAYEANLVNQLSRQLNDTRQQLADVQQTADAAQAELQQSAAQGVQNIAQAIQKVENPALRLQLFKAYAAKVKAVLTPESQKQLNTIVVYVEKDPTVLIKPPATWPSDVQAAVTAVKAEITKAKTKAVATVQLKDLTAPTPVPGKTVVLTGILEFVSTDPVTGAGVFKLTNESDELDYYFQFSPTNTEEYKTSLVGQTVKMTVKITGEANGLVTYDVVSGPTAASTASPSPTIAP